MALLTPLQRKRILKSIRLQHYALLVELLGDNAVSKSVLSELKKSGVYRKRTRPDIIRRAFQYGKETFIEPKTLVMKPEEFENYITKKAIVFDTNEIAALKLLRKSVIAYLKSLGEMMYSKVNQALLKSERQFQRQSLHKRDMDLEFTRRKALSTMAKDLRHITETQLSDAIRIASTETNNAFQDGRAQEILKKSGERDPLVFKLPRKDACEECKQAYLEEDGVTPRLFHMSELVENGSNIGKAHKDRQPVVDSYHPYCCCVLLWLPPGFGFDAQGTMVYQGLEKVG